MINTILLFGMPGGIEILILFIILVPFCLLPIISQWRIFEKAGEPGWAILIPIYNSIVLLKIVGKPWWWLFLFLIPIVNLVFFIWQLNLLSKSFGKDEGFTVGLVLLPFIFLPILGLGNAVYKGPAGK